MQTSRLVPSRCPDYIPPISLSPYCLRRRNIPSASFRQRQYSTPSGPPDQSNVPQQRTVRVVLAKSRGPDDEDSSSLKEEGAGLNDNLARNKPGARKNALKSLAQDAFVQQRGLGKLPLGRLDHDTPSASHIKSSKPTLPQGSLKKTNVGAEELGDRRSSTRSDHSQSLDARRSQLENASTNLERHKSRWGRFAEDKAKRTHPKLSSVKEAKDDAFKVVVQGPNSDAPAELLHDLSLIHI